MKLKSLHAYLRNKELINQFIEREVAIKYRGSVLGITWAVITPLTMLTIYTVVFSSIFNVKWGTNIDDGNTFVFGINLYAGLLVFNYFTECISRAPRLLRDNPAYIKKVVFPIETLGFTVAGSAMINSAWGLGILILFNLIFNGNISFNLLYLPAVWIPLTLLCIATTWAIATIGVYIKDIENVVSPSVSMLMFVSPIFYSSEMVPESIRWITKINPLTIYIEETRKILISGMSPDASRLVFVWCGSLLWYELTYRVMKNIQPKLSDYI